MSDRQSTWDRSLLPEALAEFVVLTDTHDMLDPGDAQVEFSSRRLQSQRAHDAWQMVADLGCQHVFHLGDLVQDFPETDGFADAMTRATGRFQDLGIAPHIAAGNHDIGDKPDPTMPTRPVSATSLGDFHRRFGRSWFSVDVGPIHVIVLNSQIMNTDLPDAALQREWFEAELDAHTGRRLVVMLHLPPFLHEPDEPSLGHYDNIADPDRGWMLGLLAEHNVESLLAAHVHCSFLDRIGPTRYRILNSTTFTRPGFCHAFTSAPPPDQGRDDTPKLGMMLARVLDHDIELHWLPTHGPEERAWNNLVTRTSISLPQSILGLDPAHPISVLTEIPRAWPSSIRQSVRNDYPVLAALQLGSNTVKVPARDLEDPFLSRRIEILRKEKVQILACQLWSPDVDLHHLVDQHRDHVDAWEWQLAGVLSPSTSQLEIMSQMHSKGISQSLSTIRPGTPVPNKQHPRTTIGFPPEALGNLDAVLRSADVSLDRVLCRLDPLTTSTAALRLMERVEKPHAIRALDWYCELSGTQDKEMLERVVAAFMTVATQDDARLFVGPLQDLDRTMDLCHGLLDPLCNPRPIFTALRCLNSLFSGDTSSPAAGMGPLSWTSSDLALVGQAGHVSVLIPRTTLSGQDVARLLGIGQVSTDLLRIYDLVGCRVTTSRPDDLPRTIGPGWSDPILLIAEQAHGTGTRVPKSIWTNHDHLS